MPVCTNNKIMSVSKQKYLLGFLLLLFLQFFRSATKRQTLCIVIIWQNEGIGNFTCWCYNNNKHGQFYIPPHKPPPVSLPYCHKNYILPHKPPPVILPYCHKNYIPPHKPPPVILPYCHKNYIPPHKPPPVSLPYCHKNYILPHKPPPVILPYCHKNYHWQFWHTVAQNITDSSDTL